MKVTPPGPGERRPGPGGAGSTPVAVPGAALPAVTAGVTARAPPSLRGHGGAPAAAGNGNAGHGRGMLGNVVLPLWASPEVKV